MSKTIAIHVRNWHHFKEEDIILCFQRTEDQEDKKARQHYEIPGKEKHIYEYQIIYNTKNIEHSDSLHRYEQSTVLNMSVVYSLNITFNILFSTERGRTNFPFICVRRYGWITLVLFVFHKNYFHCFWDLAPSLSFTHILF